MAKISQIIRNFPFFEEVAHEAGLVVTMWLVVAVLLQFSVNKNYRYIW